MSKPKHDILRIRVDAQGYDASGAYWGAGPDVFIATSKDGSDESTVRARNVTEARAKVAAEMARRPGQPTAAEREPIGGNAPRKTRYEIEWLNPVDSQRITIRITHARDYLARRGGAAPSARGTDHLEVESIKPARAPLPITETGYRSHVMAPLELMNAGGPVTFVTAWIEQEAKGKAWSKAATAKQQGDLFSWADAQGEVGNRKKPAKPQHIDGKASQRPRQKRDPA